MGTGLTKDGFVLCSNGDVEDFDESAIERELGNLAKPGYYEKFCLPRGGCEKCEKPACPITN